MSQFIFVTACMRKKVCNTYTYLKPFVRLSPFYFSLHEFWTGLVSNDNLWIDTLLSIFCFL